MSKVSGKLSGVGLIMMVYTMGIIIIITHRVSLGKLVALLEIKVNMGSN